MNLKIAPMLDCGLARPPAPPVRAISTNFISIKSGSYLEADVESVPFAKGAARTGTTTSCPQFHFGGIV